MYGIIIGSLQKSSNYTKFIIFTKFLYQHSIIAILLPVTLLPVTCYFVTCYLLLGYLLPFTWLPVTLSFLLLKFGVKEGLDFLTLKSDEYLTYN